MTRRLSEGIRAGLDFVSDPYAADPVGWARDVLGVHLWSKQQEIVESVRDHSRTAVRSGHGIGKTLSAAVVALWFLDTHANSRVVTTATTWPQVEKLLWHEVNELLRRARDRPQAQGRPIFAGTALQVELRLGDGRYAIGLSSKPENSESFAGHHAPWILLIVDEASGVHPKVFEVGEGYMTTDGARLLLIGNPTRNVGELYDAFHSKRADYSTIAISALDSPAITGEEVPEDVRASLTGRTWVESRKRAWGDGSPIYQVRVLGQFAKTGADTEVMALADVEAAQAREMPADPGLDEIVVACDVARFGSDETVIAVRVGLRIRVVERYVGKPTTHTAGRVAHWAEQYPLPQVRIVVDDTGVGGGVTDQLRADGRWRVTAFNASERAYRPHKFPNRRSELWFAMADQLEVVDLDGDDQLAADLTSPQYGYDAQMRQVVEPKAMTRKRLGRSPDRADGVMLTLVGGAWTPAPEPTDEDECRAILARMDAARVRALEEGPVEQWAAERNRDDSELWRAAGLNF